MPEISLEDIAKSFGTTVDDFSNHCLDLIKKTDLKYREIKGEEKDQVILKCLKKVDSDKQRIGAPKRHDEWEKGWSENLNEFIKSNYDLDKLVPKFVRPNQPIRYNQSFIMPSNPNFELDYFSIFRRWLFEKYFKDFSSVYEFGCGTGFNLVTLAKMYPDKKLYGLDFVSSSKDLVNEIAKVHNFNLKGLLFDMIKPDYKIKIDDNSILFTFGAIEQLASKFENFIDYILKNKPKLCINLEPTIELYDENNLIDYLAIKFHKKRGYTQNLLPYLKKLEKEGKIDIIKIKRLYFGSLFMEGFSYIIWKPKNI